MHVQISHAHLYTKLHHSAMPKSGSNDALKHFQSCIIQKKCFFGHYYHTRLHNDLKFDMHNLGPIMHQYVKFQFLAISSSLIASFQILQILGYAWQKNKAQFFDENIYRF